MSHNQFHCALCGGTRVKEVPAAPRQITFEGKHYPVHRIAMLCEDCEFSWFAAAQIDRNIDAYWAVADSIDGYFDPQHVLTIRETYDITMRDAGLAFGISGAQYAKYENGLEEVPRELGDRMRRALTDYEYFIGLLVQAWRSHGLHVR